MEFSWPLLAVLLLLGAVQLAMGVVLGCCLPMGRPGVKRARREPDGVREVDPHRLRFFAHRLLKLAAGVSGEVANHRSQIVEVSRDLAAAGEGDAGALTDSVLRSIARMVAANDRLQNRLKSAEQRLQQQNQQIEEHFTESRTDPLTGLMNRRAFDDTLSFQIEQGNRPFALMMVDVDHFKELNDEHGHPAGDDVLCGVSQRLKGLLGGTGMVARYGGEEFAVFVPSVNGAEARQIAERLRLGVAAAPFSCEPASLPSTVSLGVALVAEHDDAFAAFKRSDEALYTAKRSGRNCAFFHDGARCRRIEIDGVPSELPPATAASRPLPAAWTGKPADTAPSDESFDDLSADLRRRMFEVARSA